MGSHTELWEHVNVLYNYETGVLDIRDSNDISKQLGLFVVMERD